MSQLTDKQVLALANYHPGTCLCGHGETCPVCSRSSAAREFEADARKLALETLSAQGIQVHEEKKFGYANIPYSVYSVVKK